MEEPLVGYSQVSRPPRDAWACQALVQRSWWLQQGRDPAVLLLKIIHKTLTSVDKGYIGAFVTTLG